MTLGLPLSSEVWRSFLDDTDEVDIKNCISGGILDWEWLWFKQVASLPKEGLNLTDPYKPVIEFKLRCEEYWIVLMPGSVFPSQPPTVSTLSDIAKCYHEYCEAIDVAIWEIKLIENSFFTLLGYSLHDEETECFVVQLCPKTAVDETITVHVDWRNPFDFPRFISSTDEQRFLSLNCDVWDVNEHLCTSLEKLIKEE
ncbi:hypothetical protein Angca_000019, partial [Angiostrongylus cantonensis]